jgi:hypothetical protein
MLLLCVELDEEEIAPGGRRRETVDRVFCRRVEEQVV